MTRLSSLFGAGERPTEKELRASEERTRSFFESAPLGIIVTDLDGYVLDSNVRRREMLGYTADELVGMHVSALTHPDDRAAAVGAFEELAGGRIEQYQIERRDLRKDGTSVWTSLTVALGRDADGRPEFSVAMAEDISARKQAEEARARLAAIVESSDDAILGGTPEGLITSWNRGAELLFGYPAEEVVGGHVSILTPPDRSDEPARLLERLRRRESIAHFETRRVRKDGTQLDVSMSISPLIGADGELAGFSTIVRDITELKSNEAERDRLLATERERNARLRQLDRLKDTFVASVSHELRTPLTSIRGYLELVLDGEAGELLPEQTEFLRIVDRNAERLLKLVGDLLDVAQVDAGRLSLDRRACDLAALVAECVERAAPDAAARELDLGLEARQVPLVPADPARVGQVLDNLISNALKFTPAGGSVRLSVAARNGHVRIDVADTGMGIPEAEKAHLFGRFFRSSNATEGAVAGTGLGLWITRAIVDAHGGRISFKSEEGVGTTFSVEFPSGPPDVVVAPGGESAQAAA